MGVVLAAVSLVLAVPPVIKSVVKLGTDVARRIEAHRGSLESWEGLAIFRDEAAQTKLRFGVGYQICNNPDPAIDEVTKGHLDQKFQEIQRILHAANGLAAELERGGINKFWKAWKKVKLRKDVESRSKSLKSAVESFNNTVNLVHVEQTGPSNTKLSREIFRFDSEHQETVSETSFFARGHLAQDMNKVHARKGPFLLEPRPYTSYSKDAVERSLAFLAKSLTESYCALRLTGYVDDPEYQRFLLVFDVPDALTPAGTVRSLLDTAQETPSLNLRVALCSKLAGAILEVHRLRMVHMNVNSANILAMVPTNVILSEAADQHIRIFLLDWRLVRKIDAASIPSPERKWWRGIYQYPGRQLALTEDEYTMGMIHTVSACVCSRFYYGSPWCCPKGVSYPK